MKAWSRQVLFPVILLFVVVGVALVNFEPDKWLMGWDTLHPELNLKLNLWRVLNGVWREDQGLGTLAAHAHMSELPRILILAILSVVIPLQSLRWWYILGCLIAGVIGMYWMIVHGFLRENHHKTHRETAGFLGALFYLFNLGTLQHFFVVFEMFVVAYAAIPWLLWFGMGFIKNGSRKILSLYLLVSFLASPMAYASVLWFVTMGGIFSFCILWKLGNRHKHTQRVLGLIGLSLLINAFWLLPNIYFLSSGAAGRLEHAKINRLFSPEAFLHNQAFGDIGNTLLIRNFLFNWQDLDFATGEFTWLLRDWVAHVDAFIIMGWLVAGLAIGGLFLALKKHYSWAYSLVAMTVGVVVVLVNAQPPFSWFLGFFRDRFDLVREALRLPFTKFSLLLMTGLAVGYGMFFATLSTKFQGKRLSRFVYAIVVMLVGVVPLVIWCKPMFEGQLISKDIRLRLPVAYRHLYDFMNTQPQQSRVAVLPVQTPFGWEYFKWGFQGAGFLWFGMPQAVVVRDFDRWSSYNEEVYLELSRAVYLEDTGLIAETLEKYDIDWLLLDKSISAGDREIDPQWHIRLKETLLNMGTELVWNEDFLELYKIHDAYNRAQYIWTPPQLVPIQSNGLYQYEDLIYEQLGNYVTAGTQKLPEMVASPLNFPFINIDSEQVEGITYHEEAGLELSSHVEVGTLSISRVPTGIPISLTGKVKMEGRKLALTFQPWINFFQKTQLLQEYVIAPIEVKLSKPETSLLVRLGGQTFEVNSGEETTFSGGELNVDEEVEVKIYSMAKNKTLSTGSFLTQTETKCWERSTGGAIESTLKGSRRTLAVQDASACVSVKLGSFNQPGILKVQLPYQSHQESRPHFCVVAEGQEYTCLNEDVYYKTLPAPRGGEVTRWVEIMPGKTYWLDVVARPPDNVGGEWEITYNTPLVTYYPDLERFPMADNFWSDFTRPRQVGVRTGEVTVNVNTQPTVVDWKLMGKTAAENCDFFKRGIVSKTGSSYTAQNRGAACDLVTVDDLSNHEEYIMRWKGENTEGRGLKVYLFNSATGRNDLETLLPTGLFDASFGVWAWPHLKQSSYNLSIENRSFGQEISQNRIDQVAFYRLPLRWLSQIQSGKILKQENNLRIDEVKKYGTSHYEIAAQGNGVLGLSQGFDDGWVGYRVRGVKCEVMCRIFPWFFGEKLEHVKVNGWANGWIVPAGRDKCTVPGSQCKEADLVPTTSNLVLIYWPQYLEWIGLGFLPITFGALLLKKQKRWK